MHYEMTEFMRSCVKLSKELAPNARLRAVDTPFLEEDQRASPHGRPLSDGKETGISECPWCYASYPAGKVYKNDAEYEASVREREKHRKDYVDKLKKEEDQNHGQLASVAANIVMNILYGARFVRMDLLRIIGYLACSLTRWTPDCDKRLHRLVCYIDSTIDATQVGWIGDPLTSLLPVLYADADLAGHVPSQRSTTGVYFVIRGPRSCWPISGVSKRQGCVSTSTPESEKGFD